MTSHSRSTSPPGKRFCRRLKTLLPASGAVITAVGIAVGGTYTRNTFTLAHDGVADSNLTETALGVGLAVEREVTIKLTDDQLPAAPNKSFYPDVVSAGIDTFSFFYVDSAAGRVVLRGYHLQPGGAVLAGAAVKACDISAPQSCYLHADQGDNGYCASYITRGSGGKRYLQLSSGAAAWNVDSSVSTGWLFSSQCRMAGDTFLVIASVDMNRVTLRKLHVRGAAMSNAAIVTMAAGSATPGNALMNCSVAADSAGTVCATAIRGSPAGDKYLLYQFYGRDLSPGPAGSLADPVSNTQFYYYDDVPVAAYGPGRFALVSWDENGVLLHCLTVSGNTVQKTTQRIIAATGIYSCAVAANRKYLTVICIGDVDGNGTGCIEGLEFPLSNYTPGIPSVISFSDAATAVQTFDRYSTALNIAMDDSGNIAVTWRNQERVAGCIWSHRGVRYRRGFYTSPVESIAVGNDSVQFAPALVSLSSTASWNSEVSLRIGAVPSECVAAPWISLSDPVALRNNRTCNRYFQFRVTLNRSEAEPVDSLTTPSLTAITVPWNTQPRPAAIDSVSIGQSVRLPVAAGDTIDLIARLDSARIALRGHDADGAGTLMFCIGLTATPQEAVAAGGPDYYSSTVIHPLPRADTVYACPLQVRDAEGWQRDGMTVFFRTRNCLPRLSLRMALDRSGSSSDTVEAPRDAAVVLQEEDGIAFLYAVSDSNDASSVRGYISRRGRETVVRLDSATSSSPSIFMLRADTVAPADTVRLEASVKDPDTAVSIRINVLVNHRPRIRAIVSNGDTLAEGDTLNVVIGDTTPITVLANDTDCAWWDTLAYLCETVSGRDSVRFPATAGQMRLIPVHGDTLARFSVVDRFGRSDSMTVHLAYPWYETDSAANPGYVSARRKLLGGASLICGSGVGDTVVVPLLNSGRNRLRLTGCSFTGQSSAWLRVVIDRKGSPFTVSASNNAFLHAVPVEPGATMELLFIFSADSLGSDGVRCDSVVIATDDPRHRRDSFAVCLEHNDLPFIVSVKPDFIAERPYRSIPKRAAYVFPPHAAIAVAFSEPMDSASAAGAVKLYSLYDARATGRVDPIPHVQTWVQNYTVLSLSPRYEAESPAFNLRPPPGLFIPTDSLILVMAGSLHDRASTPSGPNPLDLNRDFIRDAGRDTSIGMRVDSIDFTVLEIDPPPGSAQVARRLKIALTFSSPVYAASIDTSLVRNRSFAVTSAYNDGAQLPFDAIKAESTSVVFTLGRELFYRDSLQCFYRSRFFSDRLGFSADNNGDGIDATMFDTAASDDDLKWGYRVKSIAVVSVEPRSGAVLSEVSPLITIRFDDRLLPGTVDTDTSVYNRSFVIGSGRTGSSSFTRVLISPDSTTVQLMPRMTFFANDSIYCIFRGLSSAFRYNNPINLPDTAAATFGNYEWWFRSGEIGFYTFPNPYKPGKDPRHCSAGGPCGIWFKNLHTLAADVSEVSISVFSITAHPVFDSRKTGERIRFGPAAGGALPQWCWDTRNNRGELVASGMYLYAVYHVDGTVLQKGKLIIAR